MPVDYLKIYQKMLADVPLVKVRQNCTDQQLYFYMIRLLQFRDIDSNVYAFTISPKSSPLLKNRTLKAQHVILVNYLRQTLPLYANKYISIFETYADNLNLHCHGMMSFRTLDDIKKFKRDARQFFKIELKVKERDKLTHVKPLGFDTESRCRWIGYCYTELAWAIKNELTPVFRWDDEYVKPIEHTKPKRVWTDEQLSALMDEQSHNCFSEPKYQERPELIEEFKKNMNKITLETYSDTRSICKKSYSNKEYGDWAAALDCIEPEEEIETVDQSEQPDINEDLEYLEYLRLKYKFEEKTSSNFII